MFNHQEEKVGLEHHSHHKKHHVLLICFAVFFLIVIFLFYTSNGFGFTGNTVKKEVVEETGVLIDASLEIPDLKLKGEFSNIVIKTKASNILVEGESFDTKREMVFVLKNFNGKIYLNESKINLLSGKAENVLVNDVSVSPSKDSLRIKNDEDFSYSSLEIENGLEINKIEYETSGKINVDNGKYLIDVNNENVILENFFGVLKIQDNKAFFNGNILSLDVEGDSKFSISV
jgi:hypothetical protein